MKQIKIKNKFNSVLILLVFLIFGFVVLGAVQKKQDTRSSAAGSSTIYCRLYEDKNSTTPIGNYTVGSIINAYEEPTEEGVSFNAYKKPFSKDDRMYKIKCFKDGWRSANYIEPTPTKSNEDSLCKKIGGTCTADSPNYCKTPQGLNGMVKTGLCGGNYKTKYCCVLAPTPTPTKIPTSSVKISCASKGGACVGNVRTCQIAEKGKVVMGTTCSGSNPVCCKVTK